MFEQNTKAIATFQAAINLQSKSINFKFGHFEQNTKAIALLFCQKSLILITFQSAIKINQFQIWSFWAKYQGYSLTFSPKIAHILHFSICNQNQSISNLVNFEQNTKAIALLFRQTSLIFITFQSAIKINQFSNLVIWAKYQGYSLTFSPKIAHFHPLFNLQSKSINFKFGHFWAKYQGYSLTFVPKIAHFNHFSICNQNQSISNLVMFEQNTKAIALLFRQKSLIFSTFQSAIKINQFQIWSFLSKIPRL